MGCSIPLDELDQYRQGDGSHVTLCILFLFPLGSCAKVRQQQAPHFFLFSPEILMVEEGRRAGGGMKHKVCDPPAALSSLPARSLAKETNARRDDSGRAADSFTRVLRISVVRCIITQLRRPQIVELGITFFLASERVRGQDTIKQRGRLIPPSLISLA